MYRIRYNLSGILLWLGVLTVLAAIFSQYFAMELVTPLVLLVAAWIVLFALSFFVRVGPPPGGHAGRPDRANPPGTPHSSHS